MEEKKWGQALEQFHTGESVDIYRFLGAHPQKDGTWFSLWAPGADSVSVCGDFNLWQGMPMQREMGIWRVFVPDVGIGSSYKFRITRGERSFLKSDPFAFYSQMRPDTASIVTGLVEYSWQDEEWIRSKEQKDLYKSPINIYEVHLGSFATKENGKFYSYREIAPKLTNYLLEMGYNYVEFMPICEYPLDASWGYQTTGYYSVTSRYGTCEDFKFLVDTLHSANIGVLLDWVPGHFCRDCHGLYQFDGGPLFEYADPIKADNPGWGTSNFDFSKPEVVSFLISNACFWMEEYHVDGLRVDAVANMLFSNFGKADHPALKNQFGGYENIEAITFIRNLNQKINHKFPHNIMAAEDSSDWPMVTKSPVVGGLGFTFKWNMGWMNDSLDYMKLDPVYRKYHHDKLTFPLCYAFSENYILPISHDEVVHGKCSLVEKMPGYHKDKLAQLKTYLTYMFGTPGKKLLFMGCEFAHALEWRFYESLEWDLLKHAEYAGVKTCISDLNHLYLNNAAMWQDDTSWGGFQWCDPSDKDKSILSFARFNDGRQELLVFICNFTPMKYENYPVGIPRFTDYEEIFNTDNIIYGGNNILNRGIILPKTQGAGEMPFHVKLTIPPFGGMILRPVAGKQPDA